MARKIPPDSATKLFVLPLPLIQRIKVFRHRKMLDSERDAVQILLERALDAEDSTGETLAKPRKPA